MQNDLGEVVSAYNSSTQENTGEELLWVLGQQGFKVGEYPNS